MAHIISSGITSTGLTVNEYEYLTILYGASANQTTVNKGGKIFVSSGGEVNNTWIRYSGELNLSSGGIANSTTIGGTDYSYYSSGEENGRLTIQSGGTANYTSIYEGGRCYVYSGGTANGVFIRPTGSLYVSKGASAFNVEIGTSGRLDINTGVEVDNTTIRFDGQLHIRNGGIANNTTITSGGKLYISKGGLASNTIVNSGGEVYVSSGGTALIAFNPWVAATIFGSYGATITYQERDARIYYGCSSLGLLSKAYITDSLKIQSGNSLIVYSGGTASKSIVGFGGQLLVSNGGLAKDTSINYGGSMFVSGGGKADGTTIFFSCNLTVSAGGSAINTTVSSGGSCLVFNGGRTDLTTVSYGGHHFISSGGTTNNTTVESGGSLILSNGAVLTGQTTIANGAAVTVESGAVIDFDISNLESGAASRINNLSLVSGWENASYLLNVTSTQEGGSYTLADNAANFDKTITVRNELGNSLGVLSLGETLSAKNADYLLDMEQSALVVTISWTADIIAPTVSNVRASITSTTNQDVVLTADFGDNVELASSLYKIGENGTWKDYQNGVTVTDNATVYFKAVDTSGNTATASYEVTNIDKVKPVVTLSGDCQTPLRKSTLTATVDDGSRIYYRIGDAELTEYTGTLEVKANGTYHFQATDAAGNTGTAEITFGNIDTTAPVIRNIAASTTGPAKAVTVTAAFADDVGVATSLYKLGDNGLWLDYPDGGVTLYENGTVYFKATDTAGNESEVASFTVDNIDNVAPSTPDGLQAIVSEQTVALLWNVSTDDSGVMEYVVTYSLDGQEFTARTQNTHYVLTGADFGTWSWSVRAVDFAGNASEISAGDAFTVKGFQPYVVEYSTDGFEHVIRFVVSSESLDSFRLPTGTYQWRVKNADDAEWQTGAPLVSTLDPAPAVVRSNADGNADVFFANAVGTWGNGYFAQNAGSIGDWDGTLEYTRLYGKNQLADFFEGSTDANVLLLTDDANGDALFVDDIYTELPGTLAEQQARIAQIDEVRAGAGDDIVDLTSQRFEYIGGGLIVRGGDGDDTIWANKGDNFLFGDAGSDRIVGASGDDVIAGGIGDDSMHGGGGSDVFAFCDNWGADIVNQLKTGSVTLWFASGSLANWDASTLTYTDGDNSVRVFGVTSDRIELKFGENGPDDAAQFAALTAAGAFDAFTSRRIFEESETGIAASPQQAGIPS